MSCPTLEQPCWSRDGKKLYYTKGGKRLSVDVTLGKLAGKQVVLFEENPQTLEGQERDHLLDHLALVALPGQYTGIDLSGSISYLQMRRVYALKNWQTQEIV